MSDKLERAAAIVTEHMVGITALFIAGVKITVIVRRPGAPDQDFLMTDDHLPEVVELIRRRTAAVRVN